MARRSAAAAALAALFTLAACEVSFNVGDTDGNGAKESAAPPASRHFVNSREQARSDALRQNYVDFSFDYPGNWSETPQPTDGSALNYVRVAAPPIHGYTPFAFHVGYASGSGDAERDRAELPALAEQMARQFGEGMQDYRVVSVGPERVGQYESWSWRFTAAGPATSGEPAARIFGRGDIVLPPGWSRGVTLISLATDRARTVQRAEEVGESGPLAAIFESLRLSGGEASK